ncbi:MAG: hypothetical protein NUW21_07935, partial [Elusimicrobia bacterium]|nr:hypothetical protein [Elusimicrobiota bacterium]
MKRALAPLLCVLLELPAAAAVVAPRLTPGLSASAGPTLASPASPSRSFQLPVAALAPSLSAAALLAAPSPVPVAAAAPVPAAFAAHPLLAA